MMETIREQVDIIKQNIDKINTSKDFILTSKRRVFRREPRSGNCTTYCPNCVYTCHDPCYLDPDSDKKNCTSMGGTDFCEVCPGRCHYTIHQNNPYKIVYYMETITEHIKEKEKAFYDAKSSKSKAEQLLIYKEKEFEAVQIECLDIQEEIKKSIDRLKEIALIKTVYTSEEYIDILITAEFQEKKPGYKRRINALEELKKQHKEIRALYEGRHDIMTEFHDFMKNYIQAKRKELKKYSDSNCTIF